MERFCKELKKYPKKIIRYEKIVPLTDEENKSYKSKKYVIYAENDLVLMTIIKSIIKSEIIVSDKENIEELPMIFVI